MLINHSRYLLYGYLPSRSVPKGDVSYLGLLPAIALPNAINISGDYASLVKCEDAVNMKMHYLIVDRLIYRNVNQKCCLEICYALEQRHMSPLLEVFGEFEIGMDPWRDANIAHKLQIFLAPHFTLVVALIYQYF